MKRFIWVWVGLAGVGLGAALFLAGYVVGSLRPLPWLQPAAAIAQAPAVSDTTPATPAASLPTATPLPSATPAPTGAPAPSVTPFPTPTERFITPQPTRNVTLPPATQTEVDAAFQAFREVWDLIHTEYINRPVDDVALVRGAIRGMVRALEDPFSGYSDPVEFRRQQDDLNGEFEGIGVEVAEREGRIVIVAPIAGSPAEKAGLLPGDIILRVDDRNVMGLNVTEIGGLVRGPAGSVVRLTVQRQGVSQPFETPVTRARIQVKNVETRDLFNEAREAGIVYVKLSSFGQRSAGEMREALRLATAADPKGLILDLRGNPGGSLFAAIDIVSQFIGDGVVMLEEDADGKRQVFTARPNGLATRVPLAVLIDKGSASASEIVAGAIKDRARGTLIGETTFGKGTVQNWNTLGGGEGGLRLTIARWLTPNGTWVHGKGIAPDIAVPRTSEDRLAGRDPQLDRAVQHLRGLAP